MKYELYDRIRKEPIATAEAPHARLGLIRCMEKLKAGGVDWTKEVKESQYWDWELRDEAGDSLYFRFTGINETNLIRAKAGTK
ncbi:MAG: hypothetical protein OXD43_05950 [Bacteroidetes bacterium]|nr:hypothetical protein [Bacteroidota bacterium]